MFLPGRIGKPGNGVCSDFYPVVCGSFFGYFLLGHLSFLGLLSFCPRAWDGPQLVLPCGIQGLAVGLAVHSQEVLLREMWDRRVLRAWGRALLESFPAPGAVV